MDSSEPKARKRVEKENQLRPGRGWERVSLLTPRAFFWTLATGTFLLASLLGLAVALFAPEHAGLMFLLGWIATAAITAAAASLFAAHVLTLACERQKTLEHFATVDELTGAPNRRIFAARLESEVDRCSRMASALCVVFIDIDFFKRINDDHGHQVGDDVLKAIFSRLEENLRLYDFIGRVGGDEFIMALPGTDMQAAYGVAERLRESVQRDFVKNLPQVTISLGVAELGKGMSADLLVRNADTALYTAKNNGRNRTEAYGPLAAAGR